MDRLNGFQKDSFLLKFHKNIEREHMVVTFEAMRFFRSPLERMVCEALEKGMVEEGVVVEMN